MFYKWTCVSMGIYSPGRELGRDRHGLWLPQHSTVVKSSVALETPAALHRNLYCSTLRLFSFQQNRLCSRSECDIISPQCWMSRRNRKIITTVKDRLYLSKKGRSQNISASIETGYGLDYRGVGVRVPVRQEFSLLHVVQTGSGVHPTSYTMGTKGTFPGGKAAGEWSWPATSNY
jgi:hypothetical protein